MIAVWLVTPSWLLLVLLFGPYYLFGVFIWWLIRSNYQMALPQGDADAYRTATETECVRPAEGMPVVLVYRDESKRRLCEFHQRTDERIHAKEARILDEEQ